MSGGAAFWIKGASLDDKTLAARLGGWRDRVAEKRYLRVENDAEPPRELMETLSRELHTDVLWVSMQSTVDAFELVHYCDGALLRELVYGCYAKEREWERVAGTRQPWEPWAEDPVIGEMDPMPDVDVVFGHYGLFDTDPVPAKKPKAKAKPKKRKR